MSGTEEENRFLESAQELIAKRLPSCKVVRISIIASHEEDGRTVKVVLGQPLVNPLRTPGRAILGALRHVWKTISPIRLWSRRKNAYYGLVGHQVVNAERLRKRKEKGSRPPQPKDEPGPSA